MTPIVKAFGFSTQLGAIANIVDGNNATFWAPYANGFDEYGSPFLNAAGGPNFGKLFPAIEWDFGIPVRVPLWYILVQTAHTLGPAMMIGSDNPATSVSDTVQSGDVLMAMYTIAQINSGLILETAAKTTDIRKRYYRLCQRVQPDAS